MLKFNAKAFYTVTMAIQHTQTMLEAQGRDKHEDVPEGGVIVAPITDPVSIRTMREMARELQSSLLTLGTQQTCKVAHRLIEKLDSDFVTYPELVALTREIRSRLQDELEDVTLLSLEPRERGYFEPPNPLFGAAFETKFTPALFELDEAAKCLATGRATAAVFHLMRLMEIAVRAVARCLSIPDPIQPANRNWGAVLKKVRDGIDAKWPTVAARSGGDGEIFDSLYASLDAVKNPWRNATMHPASKYTIEEAEHVLAAVRGFAMKLADRCDENGDPKA